MHWLRLSDSIYRFDDSCAVYSLCAGDSAILINAGTGIWADHLDELPVRPEAVVCTHHFRDHVAGLEIAAREGIAIYAPWWEREFFEDAEGLFQRRETYIIYDNIWDLYAPKSSLPVAGWLFDWDEPEILGVKIRVIPSAGVSPGAVSLLVEADGERVLFCGELIHSPGKLARVAPLQYHYNDLTGAVNLLYAIEEVRRLEVDVLAPSMGPELIAPASAVASALDELDANLRFALAGRPQTKAAVESIRTAPLTRISTSVFQAHHTEASTYFVVSKSGEVLALDFGYDMAHRVGSGYPYPRNRMSSLHSVDELGKITGRRRIDAVLVTHFHDDHVNGIPLLQRLFGTKCYAAENFAPILTDPAAYAFPCTWPEPIEVIPIALSEATATGELVWNEFTFRLYAMSGHTRWSTLVAFEADGKRFVATGDQYFFLDFDHPQQGPCMHNHVYRNGAELASFHESNVIMRRLAPDYLLPGHGRAYEVQPAFYERIAAYAEEYRGIHERLMPLGAEDAHFEVDSRAAWMVPYRTFLPKAAPIEYHVHVRNPFPDDAELIVSLSGGEGWSGGSAVVRVSGRGEAELPVRITPPAGAMVRRQAVVAELRCGDRSFGQVAEALVTIGYRVF